MVERILRIAKIRAIQQRDYNPRVLPIAQGPNVTMWGVPASDAERDKSARIILGLKPCDHIDYADTLDGGVCRDCGSTFD